MPQRDLDRLRQALLIVLSTPVKPGATHRLRLDALFETRLSESVILFNYIEQAFEKGIKLGRGDIDTKGLGLGRMIADALRDTFDFTGRKPVPGIIYSAIAIAIATGYSSVSGKSVVYEANRLSRILPYSTGVSDAIDFVEGLEGVGVSDYLLNLDRKGITRHSIRLNSLSLGDLAEILYELDAGFAFNARHFTSIKNAYNEALSANNILEASLRAFYKIGLDRGLFESVLKDGILEYFIKLDKGMLGKSQDNDRLLGCTYAGVALAYMEKPLPLP